MLREEDLESDEQRIERLQHSYDGIEAPLWLHMLGYADWEAEKYLLRKEKTEKG